MRNLTICTGLLAFSLIVQSVYAQDEQVLSPAELKQLTAVTEPATLYKGFFRTGLNFNYFFINTLLDKNGKRIQRDNGFGRLWDMNLLLQYGITDRLQISLFLPYQNQKIYTSYYGEAPEIEFYDFRRQEGQGKGIGDLELWTKYQILKPNQYRFLTGGLSVIFPTGNSETSEDNLIPVGQGHFTFISDINYTQIIYPFRYSGGISFNYHLSSESTAYVNGQYIEQDILRGQLLSIIGSVDFLVNDWISILNMAQFNIKFPDKVDGEILEYDYGDDFDNTNQVLLSYIPGLSFQINRLRLNQLLFFPLAGKNLASDPGFTLIVQYVF